MLRSRALDPQNDSLPDWLSLPRAGTRIEVLNEYNGVPTQMLMHTVPGPAITVWHVSGQRDNEEHAEIWLLLTAEEAEAVVAAEPGRHGFLEPVRRTIKDAEAFLVTDSNLRFPVPYEIPRHGSERRFYRHLNQAVREAPRFWETRTAARLAEMDKLKRRLAKLQARQAAQGRAAVETERVEDRSVESDRALASAWFSTAAAAVHS